MHTHTHTHTCMHTHTCTHTHTHTHAHTHAYTHTHTQGKTPHDLALENQNKHAIEAITMWRKKREPRNLWEHISRNPVSAGKVMC